MKQSQPTNKLPNKQALVMALAEREFAGNFKGSAGVRRRGHAITRRGPR